MRGCGICTQTKVADFARRPSPITKSFMVKHRPGEVLNFDGQTFSVRSWYGNYIAVINFVCVVSFKRFPFYVRLYDAPELRNALEYALRMVRLLFGVELRALHSDVLSTYYDYPVIAQCRTIHRVALDMQPPEMHYMDRNARAFDLRSLFFETRRKKAQTRRNKRQGNWGLVVVCFRGPLHPKHTKNCAFRRAVARVHYPRDMPQAPSQGTTKGTTRGKRGFGITRTRVTHARDTGARNDARDDARRRIIEATRARAAAVAATAAAAARAARVGDSGGTTREGSEVRDDARASDARAHHERAR